MRELIYTAQFRRGLRRARRRNKDLSKLGDIVARMLAGEPLEPRQRLHQLVGDWYPCWECHIEHDWPLVWFEDDDSITMMHTGTHSDIFGG